MSRCLHEPTTEKRFTQTWTTWVNSFYGIIKAGKTNDIRIPEYGKFHCMVRIFLLLILSMISHHLWSQMIPEDSIRHHAREMITERSLDKRTESFDYLNRNVGDWLMQNGVPEQEVEGMAIIEEPSTGLRVISYELYRDTSTYDYGGWIHLEGWGKPGFLADHSRALADDKDVDFITLAPDIWSGVLYYQVVSLTISDDKSPSLTFGLGYYHLFTQ